MNKLNTFFKGFYNKLNLPKHRIQKVIYFTLIFFNIIAFGILYNLIGNYLFLALFIIYLIYKLLYLLSYLRAKRLLNLNLFIFGVKGAGKDTIMSHIAYCNRKQTILSNIKYGKNVTVVQDLKQLFNLKNTYKDLIENTIKPITKVEENEGKNILLSDGSIYFPSHEDTKLKLNYASFPLYYAISRHLYNQTIIVNTQVNGRLWKSLREQVQDGYLKALKTTGFGFIWSSIPFLRKIVIVSARYYENEESAISGLLPFKKVAIINKLSDKTVYMTTAGATKEMYDSTNGKIKDIKFIIKKKTINFDSRHFHKVFFGKVAPKQ